ncbi:hypothetical protein LINPERHAP2_LOCUS33269 [Linum perenne]
MFNVKYESLEDICFSCGFYSHREGSCPMHVPSGHGHREGSCPMHVVNPHEQSTLPTRTIPKESDVTNEVEAGSCVYMCT